MNGNGHPVKREHGELTRDHCLYGEKDSRKGNPSGSEVVIKPLLQCPSTLWRKAR